MTHEETRKKEGKKDESLHVRLKRNTERLYFFGRFRLDLGGGCVYRDHQKLKLRPKTFDALVYLLHNPGRLVTKQQFMDHIWPDCFVTDGVLTHTITEIRKTLKDDTRHPQYVQTVPRRGYMWICDVKIVEGAEASDVTDTAEWNVQSEQSAQWWKRWKRPGALKPGVALAAIALVGLAVLFYVQFSPDRRTKPVSSPVAGSLAIIPFEIRSDTAGFEWLSLGLADMLSTGLWHSPRLPIVSYRQLVPAGVAPLDRSDPLSESRALELARQARVERLITGSLIRLGGQIQINAHLLKTADGFREASFRARIQRPEEIFDAVDQICFKLLRALLLEETISGPQGRHLTEVRTDSLDAYRHYIAGLQKPAEGGERDTDGALRELQEAIRIDPSFAMAHLKIAELKEWARSWGYSNADPKESLRDAIRYSEYLQEKERLLIEAMETLLVDNDRHKALALFQKLERIYPFYALESGVPLRVAGIHMKRGDVQAVIEYAEPLAVDPETKIDVRARLSDHLATAFRRRGDLAKALLYAEQAVSLWPAKESPVFVHHLTKLGRSYLDAGRQDEALECFEQARELAGEDAVNLTNAAWGFYMAGKREEAFKLAERALAVNPHYGNAYHLRGWIHLSQGRYPEAAAQLERAYAETPPEFGSAFHGLVDGDLAALYYAGVAYDKLGERDKARAVFRRLVTLCKTARDTWPDQDKDSLIFIQTCSLEGLAYCRLGPGRQCQSFIEQISASRAHEVGLYKHLARLHAVHGSKLAGLQWLQKAIAAGKREYRHIQDDPDFDNLRELPEFQKLLK